MKKGLRGLLMLMFVTLFAIPVMAENSMSKGDVEWDDGIIKFKSEDGNFTTRFDVRLFINAGYFIEDSTLLSSGTHLRKARFAMKTRVWDNWNIEWDINVAEGAVEPKDMFISYIGLNNSHIKMGHFKMPLGLDELTTSRYQTFIERSYPAGAFEVDRRVAFEYSRWGTHFNLRTAVFAQTMDAVKNKTIDETGGGYVARLVAAPIRTKNTVLHLGGAYVWENPDNDADMVEYQSEPETKLGDVEILQIKVPFVADVTKIGLESAFVYKSLTFQAEYIQVNVNRLAAYTDAVFSGGYAQASWIVTGETRPWDETQGEFDHFVPNSNKIGAWEVAARFSHLDLSDTDAGLLGGMANNITLGVNWYPNPNIKFMLNYTMVDNSENATGDIKVGNYDFSVLHGMLVAYF